MISQICSRKHLEQVLFFQRMACVVQYSVQRRESSVPGCFFSRLEVVSCRSAYMLSAGCREQAGNDGGKRGAAEAETRAAGG